ncbi:MAG: arylsulfatase [Sandaracinobacter sp.]
MEVRRTALLSAFLVGAALSAVPAAAARQPNVLLVIADDLALSDMGASGGEIATPTLDSLAASAARFSGFHVAPACSPTRAMLMTGTDHHRVGVSTMVEVAAANQRGKPGYEGFLSQKAVTVGEIFHHAGYATIWSGKWHLGFQRDADPHRRGFDRSLALLHGAHDHFGGGYSPDPRLGNSISRNGQVLAALPPGFYSSTAFADHMVAELAGTPRAQPVFAVLSVSAPHWPVQAAAEDIARQRGRYDEGWDALAQARLARQKSLGLVPADATVPPPVRTSGGWAALSSEERKRQARLMEIYAAMVARMDQELGRVIAELKRQGRFDDTLILFLSDNGPESLDFRTTNLAPLVDRWKAARNSLEMLGGPGSFDSYGAGWAEASAAPGRMFKAWSTEGGTRAPLLIVPPGHARAGAGRVVPGFTHVMDLVPTLMDYAGIADHGTRFAGRAVEPIRGRSLRAMVEGRADLARPEGKMVAGELFGQRSVFDGRWKALDTGDGQWRLFDIDADPSELRDRAADEPDRMLRMAAFWAMWAREVRLVLPDNPPYRP